MKTLTKIFFVSCICMFGAAGLIAQNSGEMRVFNVGAQTASGDSTAKHAINTKGAGANDKIKPGPTPTKHQYVGHVSLIKRTIGPNGETSETLQPLTTIPAANEKITVYTITKIETDSAETGAKLPKLSSIGVLATSLGKTVVVPFPIFDLPEAPSGLKFHYIQIKPDVVKLPDMPEPEDPVIVFKSLPRKGGAIVMADYNYKLSYQTVIDGKPVRIDLTLAPVETTLESSSKPRMYLGAVTSPSWKTVTTKCGPPFIVWLEAGTSEAASAFFNQVCDQGLK